MAVRESGPARKAPTDGEFDIVVRGNGIAALVAALDCARIGLRTVVISSDDWVETRENVSARSGVAAALCAEFGVPFDVVRPQHGEQSILGIPGSPFSRSVRKTLGWRGAWRIYLDRVRPLLAIGEERNLARLVISRIGASALEAFVRPFTRSVLGSDPENIDIIDCVPELLPAMSRVGSLTLGVLELAAADDSFANLIRPEGGLAALESAVMRRANHFAITVRTAERTDISAHTTLDLSAPGFSQALDRAVPIARDRAQDARHSVLSDVRYRPIGPVDLEG